MVKFKDFSCVFQYFSWQILFSRTFHDTPVYSSSFQACANPVKGYPLSTEGYGIWIEAIVDGLTQTPDDRHYFVVVLV